MVKSTTKNIDDMLSGDAPLVDASGNVLAPAKTNVTPTAGTFLDQPTIVRGRNGEILMGGSLIRNPNKNTDIQSARIGDYVYDSRGNAQIVPNSYRDLVNQYVVRSGESAYKGLGVYDYATALSKGLSAFFSAPTDSSNIGAALGTMAAGQVANANPLSRGLWTGANIFASLLGSEREYADRYYNQEIDYDIALDFSEDEDGNIIATPNYKKMETAGHGSGTKVLGATDTDSSSVSMSEDNQLDINISDSFANSAAFAEIDQFLKDNYSGLTKEQANEVVDEDTGATRLQRIEQDIKAAETRFYYNAKSVQAFKEIAPAASDQALDEATYTQLAGYVSEDNLKDMAIIVYNEANEREEVNAKEYLDRIKSMSKADRNSYMNSLGSRIQSDEINDDEKVILQAQANTLYAASERDGSYKGMYKKDFLDSVGDMPVPIFNKMTLGELFAEPFGGYTNLDTFESNELYAGLLQIASTAAEVFTFSKAVNGVESLMRKGLVSAGKGVLSGTKVGQALGNINEYAGQDVAFKLIDYVKEAMDSSSFRPIGQWLGKTTVQNGMQLAADATVEGLRYGVYDVYGKSDRFDFLDELEADLLFDALMTYGPRNYVTRTTRPKLKALDVDERVEEVDEMGRPTGEAFTLPGTRIVEVDADEVARTHAQRIDKLTDSDLAIKTQELLFDRNAAFGKMAVQIRGAVEGDNYLYRKMLRVGNDIRPLTNDVQSRFNQIYAKDVDVFKSKLSEIAPKFRSWTQADRDYVNAAAQAYRFSKIHEGDENAQKEIREFYSKALNGVSEDRRAQLDELLAAGRNLAANVLDFYTLEENGGVISKQQANEIANRPEYEGKKFFPVWQKNRRISGGEISMDRPAMKSVFAKDELIAVEDLEDPLVTLSQYLQNAARNVAINQRALTIQEVGSVPGMKMHIVSDTGGSLRQVENLRELSNTFAKRYDAIVKKVRKEFPTREKWQADNDKMVLESEGLKLAEELSKLQDEALQLRKDARNARARVKRETARYSALTPSYEAIISRYIVGKDPSEDAKNALRQYQSSGDVSAETVNKFLVKNRPNAVVDSLVSRLQTAFTKSTTRDLVLFSGVPDDFDANRLASQVGAEAVLKDFTSTSSDPDYAKTFAMGQDPYVLRIHVPKGTSVATMPENIRGANGELENEILLENNIRVYVDAVHPMGEVSVEGSDLSQHRVIDVELVNGSKRQKAADADNELKVNKNQQLFVIDQIKDSAGDLMRKAQAESKSKDLELDIDSYLNIQVTNDLKKALKSNASTAQIQVTLSDAVEKANPFVDPEAIIQSRAEDAAERYRKEINKLLKIRGSQKTTADKINEFADKVMDHIEEKVMGAKAGIKVIDDAEATRILNNSGDSHTIRYLLDGEEHRMVLTGPGSERLVAEFYQPEGWQPTGFWRNLLKRTIDVGGSVATAKRVLTTSMDPSRVLPNLARDWSRGVVTSGGRILLSPDMLRDWALSQGDASPERIQLVDNGLALARESVDRSTFTESLETPRRNRSKSMVRAANEQDGNGFTRFVYGRGESVTKALSTLQDMGESFTRIRAMEIAYYRALGDYFSRGLSDSEAIKRATEAAYMAGRETTTNFFRRGKLIAAIARNVPYFSQNFATLESFKYSFLDDPIAVSRALQDTTFAYSAMIAIALSNRESREKYFLLSEYDRSHNIIIPLDNDTIITIPLDETMAAFLTPYRRTIETLAGVDPEAFYMMFLETFEALSPFDLEGFSEGDKFNLVRGLEKLGAQMIPTWAQPIVESITGRDLYYGSTLRVAQEDIGQQTGNWSATPGQLTTKSKNSQALAAVSEHTGIPQWILQNMLSEYGGTVGQYALNTIDKLSGATEEAQGGKEWSDSIFKPFTGYDSNQVNNAFWEGINQLKTEKAKLQRELKTIKNQITAATGEEKANLQQKRQDKINAYGTRVSDFVDEFLSAYEITGGLSKSQANQVWYLYKIYDDDANADMYDVLSTGEYYSNKENAYNNRQATGLAASSGIDRFIDPAIARADTLMKQATDPTANYADTYGRQAHLNSIYGDATRNVYRLETALKNAGFPNRSRMFEGYNAAKTSAEKKKAKADWNTQVLLAIAPVVEEVGLDTILGSSEVLNYLQSWLFDVTTFNRKEYLKKAFGGQ